MVVYVEYVFLDNFIIDLLIVLLARKSLKLQCKKMSVSISATIGAIVAVGMPLFRLKMAVGFLLKIIIGMIIVLPSGKFRNFREYLKCYYLFIFYTFVFGGFVTAVFWGLGLSFDPISYSHGVEVPLFLILLIAVLSYCLCLKVTKSIYKKKRMSTFIVKCVLSIGGKTFVKEGFLDSGNSLMYKKTESPIVVCSQKFGEQLKRQGVLQYAYNDLIKINTVAGESYMHVYKTEKFLIYNLGKTNILNNVMIGLSSVDAFTNGEFDLLIGQFALEVA